MHHSELHERYRKASVETLLDVVHFEAKDYSAAAQKAARDVLTERGEDPDALLQARALRLRDAAAERHASLHAANLSYPLI